MLNNVKVPKDELLVTLKDNLQIHTELYDAALAVWKTEYVKAVETHLVAVQAGDFKHELETPEKPRSYAKEYERVISQLEYSADDIIPLSNHEFKQFVLDEWNFDSSFFNASNISLYRTATETLSASARTKFNSKSLSMD